MPGLMDGKRGLVMGVANDRSIAWGIASALHREGAELAFSYQGEAFGRRVLPLAERLGSDVVIDLDVTSAASIEAGFAKIGEKWGSLDFVIHAIAFSDKEELGSEFRFRDTTRENFSQSMLISCYSLIEVSKYAAELMPNGGSILTLTFEGSHRVTPCYNIMGVAKAGLETAVKYLASDLGPDGVRVNAVSPGPMKTLAGSAIGGARRTYKHAEINAPLQSNASLEAVGNAAVYLASEQSASTTGQILMVDGGYHVMGMPRLENI